MSGSLRNFLTASGRRDLDECVRLAIALWGPPPPGPRAVTDMVIVEFALGALSEIFRASLAAGAGASPEGGAGTGAGGKVPASG